MVMAPPGTITTHHITMLVIVPYLEGTRPPLGSVWQSRYRETANTDTACEAISMRVPATYTMDLMHHTGRKKTATDPNRGETIATDG
jgi:hypothetical protein